MALTGQLCTLLHLGVGGIGHNAVKLHHPLSCGVQDAAGVEDLAARVSYHGTRRVGTLVSLDHEALREIFEMANH